MRVTGLRMEGLALLGYAHPVPGGHRLLLWHGGRGLAGLDPALILSSGDRETQGHTDLIQV